MDETLLTYRIINDRETALDFAEVLKKRDITFYIEEDALNFDPSYANNPLNKDFRLKIKPEDFLLVDQAFEEFYRPQLEKIEKDYYLFSFSNEELFEIVAKRDEWGFLDYELAKRILEDRGNPVDTKQREVLQASRETVLSQPETIKKDTVVLLYFLAVLFPPAGVFTGLYWAYGKKVTPNGHKVYSYSRDIRDHGIRLFTIGLSLLIATTLYRMS